MRVRGRRTLETICAKQWTVNRRFGKLYWKIIIRIMYLWHHFLIYLKRLSFTVPMFPRPTSSTYNLQRFRVVSLLFLLYCSNFSFVLVFDYYYYYSYLSLIQWQYYVGWCANAIKMTTTTKKDPKKISFHETKSALIFTLNGCSFLPTE